MSIPGWGGSVRQLRKAVDGVERDVLFDVVRQALDSSGWVPQGSDVILNGTDGVAVFDLRYVGPDEDIGGV